MQMTYKKVWMRRLTMPKITMTIKHVPSYHSLLDKGCPSLTPQEKFGSPGTIWCRLHHKSYLVHTTAEQCTGVLTNTCMRDRSTDPTQNPLQQIWRYHVRLKPMCIHLCKPMYIMYLLVCNQNQQQPSVQTQVHNIVHSCKTNPAGSKNTSVQPECSTIQY